MRSKRGKYMENWAIPVIRQKGPKGAEKYVARKGKIRVWKGEGNKYRFGIKIYVPAITPLTFGDSILFLGFSPSRRCENLCRHWSSQKGLLDLQLQGRINVDYRLSHFVLQIFGGNAVSSIQSSLYCVLRSLLAIGGSRAQFGRCPFLLLKGQSHEIFHLRFF